MSVTPNPEPSDPHEHGVPELEPDAMQLEPARLLANEVREELRDRGFEDDQIDHWAETYVAEQGPGDRQTFLFWVEDQQDG